MADSLFWEKWFIADDIERLKLIRTLSVFSDHKNASYITPTLLNSYLEDLYNYLLDNWND